MIGIYRDELNENGRLTRKQILNAISWKALQNVHLFKMKQYYLGKNVAISKSDTDFKVPVPFGRKLLKMVSGFMFKEGLITYRFPDDKTALSKYITEVFDCNDEETTNARIGKDQSRYGSGYEILYIDNDDAHIQFAPAPTDQIIPIYDYSIKPKMIAAINHYKTRKTEWVEVYYTDVVEIINIGANGSYDIREEIPHAFGEVPVIEYRNNEEGMGDIEPITILIDAHDKVLSGGIGEDDKFADALMVLKNHILDDESIKKLVEAKLIEIDENASIEYLTKPETYSGREILRSTLEKLIHSMSGIPKLDEHGALSSQSGEAMKYLYATFEMIVAGDKQTEFTNGLQKRLRLITNIANYLGLVKCGSNGIDINWQRNLPSEDTVIIDNISKVGDKVSRKTYVENLKKAGVVEDVDEELKRQDEDTERVYNNTYNLVGSYEES